jgi:hypothetical protein
MDLATGAGCGLRVAGCASCRCCLYSLLATNLSILRPCSANALLARTAFVVCGYGRVTSYPRFHLPRRNTKLRNPNPKHDDYVYDRDANPSDGAGQRNE